MSQPDMSQRLILRERPKDLNSIMYQTWEDLLFLHWEFDPTEIQLTLPPGLTVDTFMGRGYIGISPFFLKNARVKMLPSIPGISNFLEMNVRTYVHDRNGNAGIWFYSLDASQLVAVELAKRIFKLPYHYANMKSDKNKETGEIYFFSHRYDSDNKFDVNFKYLAHGETFKAIPDSIEFFLIERYLMFTYIKENQKLYKGRIYHHPHNLSGIKVIEWNNNVLELNGLRKPDSPPDHAILSYGARVEIYPLEETF